MKINKIIFTGVLIFTACIFAASVSAGMNWSNGDPFSIRNFVNSFGYSIPTSYDGQGAMNNDNATALKICQLAGYDAVDTIGCSSPSYQGRCNFSSCGDNVLGKWNSSTNNFDIISACNGNGWISSLTCKNNTPVCTSHASQRCVGNSVYWFNSCGAQEDGFTCAADQTCQNAQCVSACTSHATLQCSGNSVYWFNSCGIQEYPAVQTCLSNQTCQNAQCVSACTSHATKQCSGNAVVWYNSCGVQEDTQACSANQTCSGGQCINQTINCYTNSDCGANSLTGSPYCQGNSTYQNYRTYTCNNQGTANSYCSSATSAQLQQTCSSNQTCSGGSCSALNIICSSNTDCGTNTYTGSVYCQGNNVYQNYATYTCNNPGTSQSYCSNNTTNQLYQTCSGNQTCTNGYCSGNINTCTYHSYQQCNGSTLYWYDSCGVQQDSQYCPNGCSGNVCQNNNNNNNNYNTCTYHAYKLCVGNNIYWFDSCGTQQDLYQTCSGTNAICQYGQCTFNYTPVLPPINPYNAYASIKCYGNNLYWYDSLGARSGLYRNCSDANSCTIDSCSGTKCLNTLKCDGSTCAAGSADYNKYCQQNPIITPVAGGNLSVAIFGKTDPKVTLWDKTVQLNSNESVYFLITVSNNSSAQANDVNVMANIPSEIGYLGNLKVNDIAVSGDIVSGISVGSLSQGVTKTVTFEGKTQTISANASKKATATINEAGTPPTDNLSINFSTGQVAGAETQAPATYGILEFLKRWYLWILVALILLFLFVVVFRRLSSSN